MSALTFKEFERREWERKALCYKDTWGTVTTQPIDAVLRMADVRAGTELLDCGSGTGALCARAKTLGARVLGCDYSVEMLRIANQLHPDIVFQREDCTNLSFATSSFDVVTMNYLLLHVAEQDRAIEEAARVLKRGGRLAITLWLPPDKSPGLNLIFSVLKEFADMSVIPPADDIFKFTSATYAAEVFTKFGLQVPRFEIFPTVWHFTSADEFFNSIQAGTRMGGLIELQKPEVKTIIKSAISERINEFADGQGFAIPTPSVIIAANKGA